MSEALSIIGRLSAAGIHIHLDGDQLRLRAPKGLVTPDILAAISTAREPLVAFLQQAASLQQHAVPVAAVAEDYPLSPAQTELWMHARLHPESRAYHLFGVHYFNGPVDVAALSAAVNGLLVRHESLRTGFVLRNGVPRQLVRPPEAVQGLEVLDMEGAAAAVIQALVTRTLQQPFLLEEGQLVRMQLIKIAPGRHVFACCMHHIIADEWSLEIIVEELLQQYHSVGNGAALSLPPLRIQYKDYVMWQLQQLAGAGGARQYWMERFSDELPVLRLRSDLAGNVQRQAGAVITLQLGAALANMVKAYARAQGATLFMLLAAAYNALLYRYTEQEDIVLGTPVSGREHPDLHTQVGLYVNMLALRTQFSSALGFDALLQAVKTTVLDAHAHAAFPMQLLQEALGQPSTASVPLFTTGLTWHAAATNGQVTPGPGFTVEKYPSGAPAAAYDLWLHGMEQQDDIQLTLVYDTGVYTANRIQRMMMHLVELLRQAVSTPQLPLHALDYISPAEKEWLVHTVNTPGQATCPQLPVHHLFETVCRQYPEHAAVVFDTVTWSYDTLNARANQLAHRLLEQPAVAGGRVAVVMDRSPLMIAAILGVLKAGAAYVPIAPHFPEEHIRVMLDDAMPAAVITTSEEVLRLSGLYTGRLLVPDVETGGVEENPAQPVTIDAVAAVMYTSGSTGKPKGVEVLHRGIVRLVCNPDYISLQHGQHLLQTGALGFDATLFEYFSMLLNGGTLHLLPQAALINTGTLAQKLHAGIDIAWFTSSWFNALADADAGIFAGLRYVLVGGEQISVQHMEKVRKACPQVQFINGYGPTENTTFSTTHAITGTYTDIIPVGRPINGSTAYVLDSRMQLVPAGVPGEIWLGGAGLAAGYLHAPDLTEQRFVTDAHLGRLYRSEDRGCWNEAGQLLCLGRADGQVKIRGFRVEMDAVAQLLVKDGGLEKVHIAMYRDQNGQQQLVAYYTGPAPVDHWQLRKTLERKWAAYMVPALFFFLPEFPLSENGKLATAKLPAPAAMAEAPAVQEALRPGLETLLAGIWMAVLGRAAVGATDNFFAIGGDSIKAIRLASRVQQELQYSLDVKDIFEHQDIRSLAAAMEAASPDTITPAERAALRAEITAVAATISHDPLLAPLLPLGWEDIYPASDIEEGILYHSLGADRLYLEQIYYQLEDPGLDPALLEEAFRMLLRQHEILRCSFNLHAFGKPVKIIYNAAQVDIGEVLYLPFDAGRTPAVYMAEQRKRPIDIEKPGLWRLHILQLADGQYGILLVIHHAIIDGWSNASLMTALSNVYAALKAGERVQLLPPAADYKDYLAEQLWQQRRPGLGTYWQAYLDDYKRTPLPFNRRSGIMDADPALSSASVLPAMGRQLIAQAAALEVQVKDIFLAAFLYLVKFTTAETDITIGIVSNGRPVIPDGDKIIGCFLHSVPFRYRWEQRRPLTEEVQQMAAQLHRHKAFDRLPLTSIASYAGESMVAGTPLYDLLFNYTDFHILDQAHTGTKLRDSAVYEKINTPFNLVIVRTGDHFTFRFNCAAGLYTGPEMQRLAGYYMRLLEAMVAAPQAVLQPAQVMEPAAYAQLLQQGGGEINYSPGQGIVALFESMAACHPAAPALVDGPVKYNYQQLNEAVNQHAHALLQQYGLQPGNRVGLLLERSTEMIISILAVLKTGAAYVPIDPADPAERVALLLADAGVDLLITDSSRLLQVGDAYGGALYLADVRDPAQPVVNPALRTDDGSVAYVMYTSGSTGTPKGVVVKHRSVVRLVRNTNYADIRPQHRVLQLSNYSFDGSVFDIFGALLNGASLYVINKDTLLSSDALAGFIREHGINQLFITTALFNTLADLHPTVFACFEKLYFGGEEVSAGHVRKAMAHCVHPGAIVHVYGPTENTTFSTYHVVTDEDLLRGVIPIGRPISHTTAYILDEAGQLLPPGVTGELFLGGAGVAAGYLERPALTAERFVEISGLEGPLYRSGDLAYWDQGNLIFAGRKDQQVKIRGRRIEPGEIEHVLGAHPEVTRAAVLLRKEQHEKMLVAYYTAATPLEPVRLAAYLQERLPAYMVPAHFIQVAGFPLNKNGKIDQRQLPLPGAVMAKTGYVAPASAIEQQLVVIWEKVLGHGPVGIHDHFFEIGGHSLKATQVLYHVQHDMGYSLEIGDLFLLPTIAALAQKLEQAAILPAVTIPPAAAAPYYPLSYGQRRLWMQAHDGRAHQAYNIPLVYELEGPLEWPAFQAAFAALVQRHESLRTVFGTVAGMPVQYVLPAQDGPGLRYTDLAHLPLAREHVAALAREQGALSFDLEKGPLFDAHLLRLSDLHFVLLLNMHHIITDGWSMSVLMNDMARLYSAGRTGQAAALPPLQIQYKDYAVWQHHQLAGRADHPHARYWRTQFASLPPAMDLVTDYKRPLKKQYEGNVVQYQLSAATAAALHSLAVQEGASLFMVLSATVYAWLYKATGQRDLVTGTPVAGRQYPELEEQIGFYLNTLALRVQLQQDESFLHLLQRVKQCTLDAYRHQSYPFDLLLEDLGLRPADGHAPLFDVLLLFNNMEQPPVAAEHADQLTVKPFDGQPVPLSAKYDLTFSFKEAGNGILGALQYDVHLFTHASIVRFVEELQYIIGQLVACPQLSLSQAGLQTAGEADRLNAFIS